MVKEVIVGASLLGFLTVGALVSNETEPQSMLIAEESHTDTTMQVIREESSGEIFEYPSIEDLEIIEGTPQDSVVHYIIFQEKPDGDEYSIK